MEKKAVNYDNAKLRRYEDDLNVGGYGIIILGAWSVLKLIIQILSYYKEIGNLEEFVDYDKTLLFVAYVSVMAVIVLLALAVFCVHLYIGRNAIKAAKGHTYKKGYYVWTVILLVFVVLGLYFYKDSIRDLSKFDTTIASIIVDLTTIYILGTIMAATRKIREIRPEEKVGE